MPMRDAVIALVLVAGAAGCGDGAKRTTEPQPFVRHVLFASADQAVVGQTMYVTSQLVNDGPGRVYWLHSACEPPFVIAMGDTQRVYASDPTAPGCGTVALDSVEEGARVTEVLAFGGALWDSTGRAFDAPEGRYVVRRTIAYSRMRDLSQPIALARGVAFRWVVP